MIVLAGLDQDSFAHAHYVKRSKETRKQLIKHLKFSGGLSFREETFAKHSMREKFSHAKLDNMSDVSVYSLPSGGSKEQKRSKCLLIGISATAVYKVAVQGRMRS